MTFVPLPDGAQVELIHSLFGVPCEVTFTFVKRPFILPPTLATLTSVVSVWWRDNILPQLSDQLLFVANQATDISAPGNTPVRFEVSPPLPGGLSTPSLSANVAVRVNYFVAGGSEPMLGCSFVPGVPSNQVAGNTINPAWAGDLGLLYSDLIDLAETYSWRWVVASRWLAGRQRTVAEPFTVVRTAVTSPWVGQRRKRLHNIVI